MRKMLVWSVMVFCSGFCANPGSRPGPKPGAKIGGARAGQMEKKQFDEAIATFKKALKEEPNSALIYNLLGMAYRHKYHQVRNQDLRKQEIAAFKKAIDLDPNYWVALINLGTSYYYAGDKAKAAPLFKKALTINPNHPEKAQLEKMIQEGGESR
jgi:tetratricopeptide (TPR) repeat protein